MQYVRNISDSVSTTWNSINPATFSGAIDVIVVEQEDGTLACSPFHVRFGKGSVLRPYEKRVEFKVNGVKQEYAMKLGEGGEAFFVFETTDTIPQSLQTSPLASPASSPPLQPERNPAGVMSEPDLLQLDGDSGKPRYSTIGSRPGPVPIPRPGLLTAMSTSPDLTQGRPSRGWSGSHKMPFHSDDILPSSARVHAKLEDSPDASIQDESPRASHRSISPPPVAPREAVQRAMTLSKELSAANIPSHVTETGDLMLDMTGFKSSEEDAIRAEVVARRILAEELEGDYDIGALFGMDEDGNLWIYSSGEAKESAMKKTMASLKQSPAPLAIDASSDPGYASDDSASSMPEPLHRRSESDAGHMSVGTPPTTPGGSSAGNPNRNYAKTLRLTSDQLKKLNLKHGENSLSFTVNRATCTSSMYLWQHDAPVVISDIDGTITKSDALGHLLPRIGRDWTHAGVAKLYSDIAANGYNIMYLTSRSVGLADGTRTYIYGIVQDGYKLPRGPTILSPDRTVAALRRELYIKKPEVFKMATLRDIRNLYGHEKHCFYAGFGNRLTDQISYRTVDVPRSRIFTINYNSEVSLDLLALNKLKLSYVNMNDVVDHYFPPVSTLVKGGGEQYTDFTYWRSQPLDLDQFSASEDDEDADDARSFAEDEEEEDVGNMGDSYLSRVYDDDAPESILSGSGIHEDEQNMIGSMIEDDDADDEDDEELEEEDDVVENTQQQLHAPEAEGAKRTPSPIVQDNFAEVITGISHLGIEKPVKNTEGQELESR
ncbi:Lipin/Ned1/Smp2-domain-containing protein [Pseudomassariella vexata]|uniref:Lipin/Ned1/Smp2-domain-containing protein n=1 Tax=Pseudomassariella vexata TaxID=1141098 RepID=A0A1Y2DD91_9PEZI|nr:Lipin/Ned1/Smp2-domain-containing protein [Pseudomassariella vexata]ORY57241.1 Lipin/Ned1/Smp2-domain-containing protein [Pseudomassariella vexata]